MMRVVYTADRPLLIGKIKEDYAVMIENHDKRMELRGFREDQRRESADVAALNDYDWFHLVFTSLDGRPRLYAHASVGFLLEPWSVDGWWRQENHPLSAMPLFHESELAAMDHIGVDELRTMFASCRSIAMLRLWGSTQPRRIGPDIRRALERTLSGKETR